MTLGVVMLTYILLSYKLVMSLPSNVSSGLFLSTIII